jgi:RNA polymerase sigma factor (sigma-70 family)
MRPGANNCFTGFMTVSARLLDLSAAEPACAEAATWDAQQAAAAAAGSSGAFQRLVERHGGALHRFCLHALGCDRDAEDICQETFVRAWHALPRYREHGQFRAWLWRIARNLCRDHARSRTRRRRWLCDWPSESPPEALAATHSPDEAAALKADLAKLSEGLALLPEGLREPLVLSTVECLPHAEVAVILGLSLRAVDTRVFRARQRLLAWWARR